MAAGTVSNFIIYHEEFWGGMTEVLTQNANVFNAASGNAIRQVTRLMRGHYERESFIKSITNLVARRDITSIAAVADTPMVQEEMVGVKLNARIGPIADTLDAFRKIAPDEDAQRLFSFELGQQTATAIQLDMVNRGLIALQAALAGQATVLHDATNGTLQFSDLIDANAKFGDRSSRLVAWVMHSKPFYDLFRDGLANYKIDSVAGMMIVEGNSASFGRPVVMTDSPALVSTTTPYNYYTMALTADALEVAESEQREIVTDIVTGLQNLVMRIQGEFAYNVKVKGFKWDMTSGAVNPTDAALGTSSNWDPVATSHKDYAGVVIQSL